MPKLTERRHLQTRSEIANAAVALFLRVGFDGTTMAHVADAAGVSRRTVYRYFPTKDDLVFEHPRRWLAHYEDQLSTRQAGESLRDLNRRALLSIASLIEDHRDDVLAAFSVLQSASSLSGTHRQSDDLWIQRTVELFVAEPNFTADQLTQAAVVAAATVAGTNTAIGLWASQPTADLLAITETVLDQLDPIWPTTFC